MSENNSTPISKVCKKCKIDKPLDYFHKSPTCKLGRRSICKVCRKPETDAYSSSHKEEARIRTREYYWANREKCLKTSIECHRRNVEASRARRKRWRDSDKGKQYMKDYWKNRDNAKRSESNAKWYANNKDKAYLSGSSWRNKNKDKVSSYRRTRRARVLKAEGSHTQGDVDKLFLLQKGKCTNCRVSIKKGYHIDHIVPLSKGGSDDKSNLQLLCKPCNLKKSSMMPVDFAWKQGRLL